MHIKLICLSLFHPMSLRVESSWYWFNIALCILYHWSILHPNLLNLNRTIRLRPSSAFLFATFLLLFAGIYIHRGKRLRLLYKLYSDEGTSLFHRFFRFWHRRGRDGRWKISLKGIAGRDYSDLPERKLREPRVTFFMKSVNMHPIFSRSILPIRRGCMDKYLVRIIRFKCE